MDPSCSDLEFFDFNNASEEEIKEIQAILKSPGSNGCVELPWEIPLKESTVEIVSQNEGAVDKVDPECPAKSTKSLGSVVGQSLLYTATNPHTTPLSPPAARLPPPHVEAFVAAAPPPPPPTTLGHYANAAPYFVSRSIPYLRAYPHMGVPFFATCPLPGTGESYGQFLPVVTAAVDGEVLTTAAPPPQKLRDTNRQFNRRSGPKPKQQKSHVEYSSGVVATPYDEDAIEDHPAPVSSATSVPVVPLPVPPGTIPLHGYPPGLHTLPYAAAGPQAPSAAAAMYYVPVFNPPYGSYIASPSAPMVLPVGLRPEGSSGEPVKNSLAVVTTAAAATATTTAATTTSVVQSNCCDSSPPAPPESPPPAAKNTPTEEMSDCRLSKSVSSSSDCVSEHASAAEECCTDPKAGAPPGCWADLFKNNCTEVNGITEKVSEKIGKSENISNGKLYSVPNSNNVL